MCNPILNLNLKNSLNLSLAICKQSSASVKPLKHLIKLQNNLIFLPPPKPKSFLNKGGVGVLLLQIFHLT